MVTRIAKFLYVFFSALPFLLALSLFTLYSRAKSIDEYSFKVNDLSNKSLVIHANITEILLNANLLACIPLFLSTIILLYYSYKKRIALKSLLVFYFIGLIILIYIFRLDPLHVLSWFYD